MQVAVLIPVKAFADAKVRLAPALPAAARAELARTMAERVVAAAAGLPVVVACDDPDVSAWARSRGAGVAWTPGLGLNGAVAAGVDQLRTAGAARVIVAHADLPMASDFRWAARFGGVTLVPDRREDGTNVACIPTNCDFTFSYGLGSFRRHVGEARRLRLPLRIARVASLAWDIDIPADLEVLGA